MKICVYSQWSLHKLYVCTTLGNNKTNKKHQKTIGVLSKLVKISITAFIGKRILSVFWSNSL